MWIDLYSDDVEVFIFWPGSYFVDIKFTDECGQVEMERVYFDLEEEKADSGIMNEVSFSYKMVLMSNLV